MNHRAIKGYLHDSGNLHLCVKISGLRDDGLVLKLTHHLSVQNRSIILIILVGSGRNADRAHGL